MLKFEVKFDENPNFKGAFEAANRAALQVATEELAKAAQEEAPHRTGELKRSISKITIGNRIGFFQYFARYAKAVTARNPWTLRAMAKARARLGSRVGDAYGRVLRSKLGKRKG